jgi:hypothetical protein
MARKRIKTCRNCGMGGLIWFSTETGWRLGHPESGIVHRCDSVPVEEFIRQQMQTLDRELEQVLGRAET